MEILKGLPVANAINEKLMEQVKSIEGPLHTLLLSGLVKDQMTAHMKEELLKRWIR